MTHIVHEALHAGTGRYWVRLSDGRQMYRYRFVVEQAIGRHLASSEHVHHVDGDRTNDTLENLRIMTAREHRLHHQADVEAGHHAKREHLWGGSHAACVECGTDERRHVGRGLCSRCYYRARARRIRGGGARQPATVLTIACEECGASFTRTLKQNARARKYCSHSCAGRAGAAARWVASS